MTSNGFGGDLRELNSGNTGHEMHSHINSSTNNTPQQPRLPATRCKIIVQFKLQLRSNLGDGPIKSTIPTYLK